MAVMAPILNIPAVLTMAPLVLRPPVVEGRVELVVGGEGAGARELVEGEGNGTGVLVAAFKLESSELAELMREEREARSPEVTVVVGDGDVVVVMDNEGVVEVVVNDGGIDSPLKVEVGRVVDVTEMRVGIEVGLCKQASDEPAPTVIAGESLPSPLESWRTMTTLVPGEIAA
jgi:hypothetical protein